MSRMDDLRQGGTPFDGFLYAPLGEDDAGRAVTVLSALARLGLDPWDEASALSELPRDGAEARLGHLLARVRDVPGLGVDGATILLRLMALLPRRQDARDGTVLLGMATARLGGVGPVLALILAILFLVQTLAAGLSGSGG